jgi:hypothetical protein
MGNPALDEFRERFTEQLVDHIDEHYGGRVDPDALRAAMDVATADWRATADRKLIRGADGVVQDGTRLRGELVEPTTNLRRLSVTAVFLRDETAEEAAEITQRIERRQTAWQWSAGDQSDPPPEGVGLLELLDQRVWWRPKDAEPLRLEEMEPSHRAHLLAFLRRNAGRYKRGAEWSFLGSIGGHHGDMAGDMLDSIMDELLETKPQNWIEQQPLVKRLRKLVKRDIKAAEAAAAEGPEEFCGQCGASVESNEHHEKCAVPREQELVDAAEQEVGQ